MACRCHTTDASQLARPSLACRINVGTIPARATLACSPSRQRAAQRTESNRLVHAIREMGPCFGLWKATVWPALLPPSTGFIFCAIYRISRTKSVPHSQLPKQQLPSKSRGSGWNFLVDMSQIDRDALAFRGELHLNYVCHCTKKAWWII